MSKRKAIIDDGCNPELVAGARFDGIMEMPIIEAPSRLFIPKTIVPFTCRNRCPDPENCAVGFFEHDIEFAEVLRDPAAYVEDFRRFGAIISPDCSLYRNAPLPVQVTNVYRNRAIGSYYQRRGVNVIALIRWGNDLSYTTKYFPERMAFLGAPKHSIIAISPYGCARSHEDKLYFKAGLEAMLDELKPMIVLVYGSMPDKVFAEYKDKVQFLLYPDWTSRVHGGDR